MALEVIFAYSYGCCVFKHNICGDFLKVLNGMPDSFVPLPLKFFANLRCPSISAAIEDTTAESHPSEAVQEPEENSPAGD